MFCKGVHSAKLLANPMLKKVCSNKIKLNKTILPRKNKPSNIKLYLYYITCCLVSQGERLILTAKLAARPPGAQIFALLGKHIWQAVACRMCYCTKGAERAFGTPCGGIVLLLYTYFRSKIKDNNYPTATVFSFNSCVFSVLLVVF